MSLFEELDYRETRLGDLSLRRRKVLSLDGLEVYEVVLGDAFLMSSLFTVVEIALADLGLAKLSDRKELDVVVGGLGLGFTTQAALKNSDLRSLLTVETLEPVIEWHQQGLVPLGVAISGDDRHRFVHGDFFAMAQSPDSGFDPKEPGRRFDAVLLDIDHSPDKVLDATHEDLYSARGLVSLARHLKPEGVFAMWSDDPPDPAFTARLSEVFPDVESHIVRFDNPLQEKESASTVYVAQAR